MTLTDLYRKALEKLQVVAAGESADASDTALIAEKYTALYNMLRDERLVSWTETGDVPDSVVVPLVAMLAFVSALEFGIDPAPYEAEGALFSQPMALGERQIRRYLATEYVSQPAQSEYF